MSQNCNVLVRLWQGTQMLTCEWSKTFEQVSRQAATCSTARSRRRAHLTKFAFAATAAAVVAFCPTAADAAGSVHRAAHKKLKIYAGVWVDAKERGAVELAPCGKGRLCGRIVWLRKLKDRRGRPLRDANNPRASRRSKPICGLQVIGNLSPQRDGSWDRGWVYDPEDGKTYDVALTLISKNRLNVRGYAGTKMFGRTFAWRRAPDSLVHCDIKPPKPVPAVR